MGGAGVIVISAIVLAAGKSTRMGVCKQLLEIAGRTVVERVLESVYISDVDEIMVVLGFMAEEIKEKIKMPQDRVKIVVNGDYEAGLSTSLKVGLRALNDAAEAVIFVLGDQPLVEASTINKLIREYKRTKALIVAPTYRGKRGNPVLLDRSILGEVEGLRGDIGARPIIMRHRKNLLTVEVDTPSVLLDIDTPRGVETAKRMMERASSDG